MTTAERANPDPVTPVLTKRWLSPESWRLATYERLEGYTALRTALAGTPEQLVALVKDSGLRGRGGAGFPAGVKWSFMPPNEDKPHYLVINADEGEPGTCKDIPLMMADPHSLIEGCVIAAYAMRSHHCFIYVRGEALHCIRRLDAAVREAYDAGYLGADILGSGFGLDITVHAGAGAYICGEETALLDSLEGRRGQPRLKPPFPAAAGLYAAPTTVNNVETIASVPFIVNGGADWFRAMGSERSPGPKIFSISGHVENPGQYEAPLGTTLRQLLELSGGMKDGVPLKFWTPGGSSTPLFTTEHLDVPLDFEGAVAAGSMLGTTAIMVFNETVSVPWAVMKWTEFYEHESCGKCTPCREGTYWLAGILQRMVAGHGTESDIETLLDICDNVLGRSFCALADGAVSPITSGIQYFRDEFLALCEDNKTASPALAGALLMTAIEEKPEAAPVPEGHVKLVIDGVEVIAPKGELLIRTAERLGTVIPRFCDHPLLDPAGACRQCLVEVEMGGRPMPKPQASCTITVADGMVVKTQRTSPVADKAQQGVMELLLINHPLDCPVCDKGGECPLQNQALAHGRADSRFVEKKRTFPKPIPVSTQVLLDRERCVLCQRCTRFSEQIAGDPFIELLERGAHQQIGIAENKPFQSYFSGNTIQICPVGALTSAAYRFRSRPFDLVSTPSICEHCSSGCAERTDWRRGKVMRKLAGDDPEVNEEWICDKGRFAFRYLTAGDRITRPMVRDPKTGELAEASWTDALRVAAEGLAKARDGKGVGVLTGGRLTVEDAYAYAKFARIALHTNDIDFRARPHSTEELDFLASVVIGTTPETGVTFRGIEAAPTVLCVALDAEEEAPVVFLRLRKATRTGRTKVFHIGQWTSPAVDKTIRPHGPDKPVAGSLLACAPGAEAAAVEGLADHAPDVAEALRGAGSVILVGERAAQVPGLFTALVNLAETTGARLAWIPRRAGERGALEAGAVPTLLPGGRLVGDAKARLEVEKAWGRPAGSLPGRLGRDTTGIVEAAAAGKLDGLVVGGVQTDDLPDPRLAEQALDKVGFLVSLELRASAVTERADVVLPVAPATEKSGTYLNWEGRRREFGATIEGTGTLSDCRVLDTLGVEMDVDLFTQTPQAAAADLGRLPAVLRAAPPPAEVAAPAVTLADGEAVLATWHRLLDNGSLQSDEPHLAGTARATVARLSPATAKRIGLNGNPAVTVKTERGSITVPAELADLPDGVVWLPANSGSSTVRRTLVAGHGDVVTVSTENLLTGSTTDGGEPA